ncbi:hypothetical protein JY651_12200 [Pyxidicoccus parkwayensis]|uniref:Uncharacterized protein n=1 Tax=Pyxidicoccus parkwayensis TaxID=2813578 RepID=A0ABX7P5B6_9BACT|nr:hypothetical protein [Pyxidicoccus parkwaysis]QSQ25638.1 hypothetical protein JY651_12200 [Pyxidicoccus parkwaysis]
MDNRRRRKVWLGVAGLLFVLAAILMFTGQGDELPKDETPRVEFPRKMKNEDRERAEKRRTWVMPAVVDAGTAPEHHRPRDPLLAALPRGTGRTAVVIEANALRHSPIGELLLDCLMRDGGKELNEFRQKSGVDPLQDLDRLVITDEGMMLSGNFGNAKLQELMGDAVSMDYGEGARVYEPGERTVTLADGGTEVRRRNAAVGMWNNQLLMFGKTPDDIKAAVDRVEGRGPDEPSVIPENSTYGEMYGVMAVDQLARMLPPDQQELAQRLRDVAQNVELHVDASSDVAMVAEVRGPDAAKVTDLGKSLGAALSLARMKAQAEGQKDVAQLLDFARVQPDGSTFKLEMAVPLEALKERLAFCKQERESTEAADTK